ncbi:sigma-54-dependent Fis family transcriptional regulator [Desulfobacter hydrogenophilus]|uniref:PAS domain-containing protein n=1 Tax=Desulfobacter hydrogenophilus TaxID=2291 RepID=A0A328FH77_9BACT|nr:sigma 54-interacting transcriptional regulator [Desulfobacter hydrogenophilus]NDY71589.1 PAS domain-containing protein [Desulfobacter hydrogenophilus]QBH15366.1 PAS domain-containing protein [Desulfobacter hydrogenophilus]RAM02443.1 sigma-54-dependent Fis family transcriptional regulator [Desulfobacter hydrogenophilus]
MHFFPEIHQLMRSPLDFAHILDEIPIGIILMDKDLRVVHLNRFFQALTGFSLDMARGIPCKNILRSSACIINCPILAAHRKNRSISCTSDIINTDRQKLPVRITTAQIMDNQGHFTGYMETIEDLRSTTTNDPEKNVAYSFANIIGRSRKMEMIFQTLPMLAQSDASILITGETGTGKDLVAEAVHQTSVRAGGPFIKINCGALPATLLESEIFGHMKGAFTGAVENKPGRFKLAHNGTIFLTEIGDLPLPLQVKLLTFLDDRIIYPLGATKGFNANVRIIAATHRDLEEMVSIGKFRKDLLFRLNVARVHLPPLRERDADIRLLLDHFLHHYTKKQGKKINGFSEPALSVLLNYTYEGNIRELKNIMEYAVNVAQGIRIEADNLPTYILEHEPMQRVPNIPVAKDVPKRQSERPPSPAPWQPEETEQTWSSVQRQMIMDALKTSRGKRNEAAQILGMSRSTLWRKIKAYQIE